jgi:hypothetical protein
LATRLSLSTTRFGSALAFSAALFGFVLSRKPARCRLVPLEISQVPTLVAFHDHLFQPERGAREKLPVVCSMNAIHARLRLPLFLLPLGFSKASKSCTPSIPA